MANGTFLCTLSSQGVKLGFGRKVREGRKSGEWSLIKSGNTFFLYLFTKNVKSSQISQKEGREKKTIQERSHGLYEISHNRR